MDYVGPFTFNCVRTLIRHCIDSVYCISKQRKSKEENKLHGEKEIAIRRNLLRNCISYRKHLAAIWNYVYNCRKSRIYYSILYYHCSNFGIIFRKEVRIIRLDQRCDRTCRTLFLCITDGFSIGKGDIYVFLGAIAFSIHILVIDYFTQFNDGVKCHVFSFLSAGFFVLFQ